MYLKREISFFNNCLSA